MLMAYIDCVIAVKNNTIGGTKWMTLSIIVSLILAIVFPLVAKYSKNLLFDIILFNSLVVIFFGVFGIITTGSALILKANQWIAIGMIMAGNILFLMK